MYTEKDNELVTRLLAATRAGKTEWLPTAYDNFFTTSLSGKYSVKIGQYMLGKSAWELTISDEQGATIHKLSSNDYSDLEVLHELARRRALRIDDTIDDILTELGTEN